MMLWEETFFQISHQKNEFGYLAMTEFKNSGALSLPNEGG
jgi:hypothetical protein